MNSNFIYSHDLKKLECNKLINLVKSGLVMKDDFGNEIEADSDLLFSFIDFIEKYKNSAKEKMTISIDKYLDCDVIRYFDIDAFGINIATRFFEHDELSPTHIHCHNPNRMLYLFAKCMHIYDEYGNEIKEKVK